jgi:hypothetical protein
MSLRRFVRSARVLAFAFLTILLLAPEWSALASEESHLQSIVGMRQFDFLVWETSAILNKSKAILAAGQQYLDEQARKAVVLDYLQLVREARGLEADLARAYGDPDILNPALATRDLQVDLEESRRALERQQLLAEAIVQEQTASVLLEQGFDFSGRTWPPVWMHMTPLPSLLVVSPRDRIEAMDQVTLETGLSTPAMEVMESSVYNQLDRSALVVPLGGIGTYPSMIEETGDINRLAEVVAHEWAHHWLALKPLGFGYAFDPNVRIINETVASIVDQDLGRLVVEKYYPELLPPVESARQEAPASEPEPPAFDFWQELADTRVRVEELLAAGRIDEAEAYMEDRRREFLENGYYIRKLNQAYFAFYGAYAAEPGGAQGENPIGPMLREIRAHSPSILAFLETVAPISSFDDLKETYERIVPAARPGQAPQT